MEILAKAGFNRLKEMFKDTTEHDEKVRWVADHIKHEPLQIWMLRNLKRDPSVWTQDNLEKVKHMDGMTQVSKEIKDVQLGKNDDFDAGMNKLQGAEKSWQENAGSTLVEPKGKKIVDFGNGLAWYDLGTSQDTEEGRALGHCGNAGSPHPNDRILSLRREVRAGSMLHHEPMLTFISNRGWLGEMKGRANSRPSEKYHPYIAELLKNKSAKGLIGAGYMPEANFHFEDLSPKLREDVRIANPDMVDLRSDMWDQAALEGAAARVPKVAKYQGVVSDIETRRKALGKLDEGSHALSPNELRTVLSDPRVGRRGLERVIRNVHRFQGRRYVDAISKIAGNPHLTESDIDQLTRPGSNNMNNKKDLDSASLAWHVLKHHPSLTVQHLKNLAPVVPSSDRDELLRHPKVDESVLQAVVDSGKAGYSTTSPDSSIWNHPMLTDQMFTDLWNTRIKRQMLEMPSTNPRVTDQHRLDHVRGVPGAISQYIKSGTATPDMVEASITGMQYSRSHKNDADRVWAVATPEQRDRIVQHAPAEAYLRVHDQMTEPQRRAALKGFGNILRSHIVHHEDVGLLDANDISTILNNKTPAPDSKLSNNYLSTGYGKDPIHISRHPSFGPEHHQAASFYDDHRDVEKMSPEYRVSYLGNSHRIANVLAQHGSQLTPEEKSRYPDLFIAGPTQQLDVMQAARIDSSHLPHEAWSRMADHVDASTNPSNMMDMMNGRGVSYADMLRDKAREAHGPGWESVYPKKEIEG